MSRMRFDQSPLDAATPTWARPLATKTDRVSYHVEENFALDQWYKSTLRLPSASSRQSEKNFVHGGRWRLSSLGHPCGLRPNGWSCTLALDSVLPGHGPHAGDSVTGLSGTSHGRLLVLDTEHPTAAAHHTHSRAATPPLCVCSREKGGGGGGGGWVGEG
eukprot:COSAG03_NODE_4604_length_1492_cov_29.669777_2_plen_160_part_00